MFSFSIPVTINAGKKAASTAPSMIPDVAQVLSTMKVDQKKLIETLNDLHKSGQITQAEYDKSIKEVKNLNDKQLTQLQKASVDFLNSDEAKEVMGKAKNAASKTISSGAAESSEK